MIFPCVCHRSDRLVFLYAHYFDTVKRTISLFSIVCTNGRAPPSTCMLFSIYSFGTRSSRLICIPLFSREIRADIHKYSVHFLEYNRAIYTWRTLYVIFFRSFMPHHIRLMRTTRRSCSPCSMRQTQNIP